MPDIIKKEMKTDNDNDKGNCILNANTFNHPFPHPYHVQISLMKQIYDTLEGDYKIGIFESPTGTGKTLSLICSTMTWLREHKRNENQLMLKKKLNDGDEHDGFEDDEPEWVKTAYRQKILGEYLKEARKYEEHLDKVQSDGIKMTTGNIDKKIVISRIKRLKKSDKNIDKDKNKAKANHDKVKHELENLDDLAPENYKDDEFIEDGIDIEVRSLLAKFENGNSFQNNHVKATQINESATKIFFVSRTHSQLSQFSSQLKMTKFPSSIDDNGLERVKYLPMGSRKQLCINESVSSLKDLNLINEKCRDLQKHKEGVNKKGCQFMPNYNDEHDLSLSNKLNDLTFSNIRDIEDLHDIGEKLTICPYYSTRKDIPIAEIISMPYQLLLHKDTRQYLGLDLKGSIIVIDEAHNLLDTISRIYSSSISFAELSMVKKCLKNYTKKFYTKMNAGNRINLAKIIKLINYIYKFIKSQIELNNIKPGAEVKRNDIFDGTNGDLLNIFQLESYLTKSKIAFKLESYMEKTSDNYKSSQPLLFKIRSFLYSLANPLRSGKFFFDKTEKDVILKYLLLDPSEDFKDIVEDSKCVLLAGGTMEPITDFTDFLVPYISKDKIKTFACNHVIPDKNLDVYILASWKSTKFEFSFQRRNNTTMIINLGNALFDLLLKIPDGIVIFFPSYKYLSQVMEIWKKNNIYEKLMSLKKIFIEERNSSVDSILRSYRFTIEQESKGALLLSVVGGKMSEGINFSDELARAVIMIGLPYPNAFSGDLIARREYIEKMYLGMGRDLQFAKQKSQEFYENLCMKAVNQSVGRAIRNINDYAVIYLIDDRYKRKNTIDKLSGWVRNRLIRNSDKVEDVAVQTENFFHVDRL